MRIVGFIFPMKEIDERMNEIILHGGQKQAIARSLPAVKIVQLLESIFTGIPTLGISRHE